MKNKIFNWTRFYNMIRSDLIMNYKRNILGILGMGVILYLLLEWGLYAGGGMHAGTRSIQYEPFFVIWCIAGIILITGYAFSEFNSKIQTANYLLLPASTLEKFLYQFLVKGTVITILFMLIFWIDARLAVATYPVTYYVDGSPVIFKPFQFSDMDLFWDRMLFRDKLAVITGIVSFITFLLSIRMFFGRYAIMKTAIVLPVLIFASVCVCIILSHIFYFSETHGFDIEFKVYSISKDFYNIQLYTYCVAYVSWIFFLVIGYFKLKEKQG